MKYELKVEYIDKKTKEAKLIGSIVRDSKEEVLEFILETQGVMKSDFFYPKYTLKEIK